MTVLPKRFGAEIHYESNPRLQRRRILKPGINLFGRKLPRNNFEVMCEFLTGDVTHHDQAVGAIKLEN
jgi:hypothetical protein